MSKKSSAKLKSKIKKQTERNANREKKINDGILEALKQVSFYPGTLIDEMCAPDKDTIVFKGMTEAIADFLNANSSKNTKALPLTDFYAEAKTNDGRLVKIRWVPYDASFDRHAIYHFGRRQCLECIKEQTERLGHEFNTRGGNYALNQIFHYDKFTPDSLIATVFVTIDDAHSIGFILSDSRGANLYLSTYHVSMLELRDKRPEQFDNYYYMLENIQNYVFGIQYVVSLYLSGEELPKLPANFSAPDDTKPQREYDNSSHSSAKPKKPSEPSCVAYIRYDAIDGKVCISNSSHEYAMKWWVITGHKRHYQSGKISDVRPYIKGDKDDPEAQKALAEVIAGQNRIKYYQLIARKSK